MSQSSECDADFQRVLAFELDNLPVHSTNGMHVSGYHFALSMGGHREKGDSPNCAGFHLRFLKRGRTDPPAL